VRPRALSATTHKTMKLRLALPILLLFGVFGTLTQAQTATFTWNGSTDSSQLIELATIDNLPVNQSNGYGGAIQIVNGGFLWLLELPWSLGFPNDGFLDCSSKITFGTKQWGTRPDGTKMDGTKAGDYYTLTGTTTCPLWNGTTDISLTALRQMVSYRSCGHGVCRTFLGDTMEGGIGVAKVQ
jgi:hypothetical protein